MSPINKCAKFREPFLKAVSPCLFKYFSTAIAKRKLSGKEWYKKDYFFQRAAANVLHLIKSHLDAERSDWTERCAGRRVLMDKSGDAKFDQVLVNYLRKHLRQQNGAPLFKEIKTQDSQSDSLLQLADMLCGAVVRSLKASDGDPCDYQKIVAHREGRVKVWP